MHARVGARPHPHLTTHGTYGYARASRPTRPLLGARATTIVPSPVPTVHAVHATLHVGRCPPPTHALLCPRPAPRLCVAGVISRHYHKASKAHAEPLTDGERGSGEHAEPRHQPPAPPAHQSGDIFVETHHHPHLPPSDPARCDSRATGMCVRNGAREGSERSSDCRARPSACAACAGGE